MAKKTTSLMTSVTKNPKPKNLFHCKLEDPPSILRVWIAL